MIKKKKIERSSIAKSNLVHNKSGIENNFSNKINNKSMLELNEAQVMDLRNEIRDAFDNRIDEIIDIIIYELKDKSEFEIDKIDATKLWNYIDETMRF